MTAESIARALKARRSGSGWMAKCPAHDDHNPSLSIRDSDGKVLLHCHAGCAQSDVIDALKAREVWQPERSERSRIVAEYDYTDEHGNRLYQVVRYQPKDFKQRRPDGCGGWTWRKAERQVLYHLPEVLEAPIVFVVEGERDVETLRDYGFVATTNAGGAKAHWAPQFTEALRGREVILIPDNDAPGRKRVMNIARALLGKVARLVVLELEGGTKDVTEWFDRGHSELELIALLDGDEVSPLKRELSAEPDLETLAGWDAGDKPPAAALPSLISATELYRGDIVALRPLFEDLLWDGLTMLIARPKAGKSWLTLQCAVHIAGGRQVNGVNAVGSGPVLYGAFEEPKARTMSRLRKLAPEGVWTDNLHFIYELLPLMGGGAAQLAAIIQKLQPRLVVLDTFTALVKIGAKGGNDVFRSQYAEVSRLRKLAEEFRTAIIVVHHMRKGISDGAIEAVAGTGGIAAAVDTLWQLKRKPEGEATLDVVGRETEERTLALRFDREPLGWRVLGDDDAQVLNSERRQVLDLLREDGGLSPAQIAAELGKSRPAVRMMLKRMKDDMQVKKQGTKYVPTRSENYSAAEND